MCLVLYKKWKFLGKRPNAKSLKCYGCICYIHVPSHMVKWGSKLDEKSIKCIHLGIDVIDGGYRLYGPHGKKFYV